MKLKTITKKLENEIKFEEKYPNKNDFIEMTFEFPDYIHFKNKLSKTEFKKLDNKTKKIYKEFLKEENFNDKDYFKKLEEYNRKYDTYKHDFNIKYKKEAEKIGLEKVKKTENLIETLYDYFDEDMIRENLEDIEKDILNII